MYGGGGRKWYGASGGAGGRRAAGGYALSMNHYHHHYSMRGGDDFASNKMASNLVFLLMFGFIFFMAQFIIMSRLNPDSLINPKHHKSKYSAMENLNTGGREYLIHKHMKEHEHAVIEKNRRIEAVQVDKQERELSEDRGNAERTKTVEEKIPSNDGVQSSEDANSEKSPDGGAELEKKIAGQEDKNEDSRITESKPEEIDDQALDLDQHEPDSGKNAMDELGEENNHQLKNANEISPEKVDEELVEGELKDGKGSESSQEDNVEISNVERINQNDQLEQTNNRIKSNEEVSTDDTKDDDANMELGKQNESNDENVAEDVAQINISETGKDNPGADSSADVPLQAPEKQRSNVGKNRKRQALNSKHSPEEM